MLEAKYAISLLPDEIAKYDEDVNTLNDCWGWTGWRKRNWPADVIKPGLRLYKFDLRRDKRRLCALLELTHGGAFEFANMDEFAEHVFRLTDRRPHRDEDPHDSRRKWQDVLDRLHDGHCCTGICLRWQVVYATDIPLSGDFPRLAWCKLTDPNYGMH
jgi:hypothetical protein